MLHPLSHLLRSTVTGAVREKEVGQMDTPPSLVGWDTVESEVTFPWWLPLSGGTVPAARQGRVKSQLNLLPSSTGSDR